MKKIYILIIIIILCSIIYYIFTLNYLTKINIEKFADGAEIYNDIFQPPDEPDSTNLMRQAYNQQMSSLYNGPQKGDQVAQSDAQSDVQSEEYNDSNNKLQIKTQLSQAKCNNNFFDKNSFCQLNNTKDKCICKFQKDDIAHGFDSPEICCEKMCNQISPDQCLQNNEFTEIPYYCNIGGKCKEYKGTVVSSHISANRCGTDVLNNQLILPYATKAECEKSISVCDKYNDPKNSYRINKASCLANTNCGFCINEYGYGKCIEGTPEGPNDLNKYYYCNPNVKNKNSYSYGDHALYIV
jgi:hypothetical protein